MLRLCLLNPALNQSKNFANKIVLVRNRNSQTLIVDNTDRWNAYNNRTHEVRIAYYGNYTIATAVFPQEEIGEHVYIYVYHILSHNQEKGNTKITSTALATCCHKQCKCFKWVRNEIMYWMTMCTYYNCILYTWFNNRYINIKLNQKILSNTTTIAQTCNNRLLLTEQC